MYNNVQNICNPKRQRKNSKDAKVDGRIRSQPPISFTEVVPKDRIHVSRPSG